MKPKPEPQQGACWVIPCIMGGTTRMVYVAKGANSPDVEKRLKKLHRATGKIIDEKRKLELRLVKTASKL